MLKRNPNADHACSAPSPIANPTASSAALDPGRSQTVRIAIRYREVAKLKQSEPRLRRRSKRVLKLLAKSIDRFGVVLPILIDGNEMVIDGNACLDAARHLGLDEVPTVMIEDLSEADVNALRIALNAFGEHAEWDEMALGKQLQDLIAVGFDLELTGFAKKEIARLIQAVERAGMAPVPGEDDCPGLPAESVIRAGDLIQLGDHLLLCGSATMRDDVARLLEDRVPRLMVTDPPYGVAYDPEWRKRAGVSASARMGKVGNDDRADWGEAYALFPGSACYIWHAALHGPTVARGLEACGFIVRAQIVWNKPHFAIGRGDYHWAHEPCLYAVRRGAKSGWQGARDQTTVWTVKPALTGEDAATVHSTQKPVEVMRRAILNNTARGDYVYDPFAGSGSTLIAAETTGRRALVIELDPKYCDMIIARWQQFMRKAAVHLASGLTYAALQQRRSGGDLELASDLIDAPAEGGGHV